MIFGNNSFWNRYFKKKTDPRNVPIVLAIQKFSKDTKRFKSTAPFHLCFCTHPLFLLKGNVIVSITPMAGYSIFYMKYHVKNIFQAIICQLCESCIKTRCDV